MRKIILLAAVTLFAIGCSSDDSKNETCDCDYQIVQYNEEMQGYEVLSSEPYSEDCDDQTDLVDNEDGTYHRIVCESN